MRKHTFILIIAFGVMSTLAYLFPLTAFSVYLSATLLGPLAETLDEAEAQRIEKKLKG